MGNYQVPPEVQQVEELVYIAKGIERLCVAVERCADSLEAVCADSLQVVAGESVATNIPSKKKFATTHI